MSALHAVDRAATQPRITPKAQPRRWLPWAVLGGIIGATAVGLSFAWAPTIARVYVAHTYAAHGLDPMRIECALNPPKRSEFAWSEACVAAMTGKPLERKK